MNSALTTLTVLLLAQATPPARFSAPEPALPPSPVEARRSAMATGERVFRKLFIEVQPRTTAGVLVVDLAGATGRVGVVPPAPPRVVCGIRVFEGDPAIDPKFVKRTPADPASMKIRRLVAPACTD